MSSVTLGLLINLPFLIAVIATLIVWRHLKYHFLFLITATLSLLGLQSAILAPIIGAFLPTSKLTQLFVIGSFEQAIIVSALALLIIGVPFLWWLLRVFASPNPSFKRDWDNGAP